MAPTAEPKLVKEPTSYRLTPACKQRIKDLSATIGVSRSGVVEIAVEALAALPDPESAGAQVTSAEFPRVRVRRGWPEKLISEFLDSGEQSRPVKTRPDPADPRKIPNRLNWYLRGKSLPVRVSVRCGSICLVRTDLPPDHDGDAGRQDQQGQHPHRDARCNVQDDEAQDQQREERVDQGQDLSDAHNG